MEGIITAGIAAIATIITTIATNYSSRKAFEKQARRTNIMCLIQMDKMNILEGKTAQNSLAIHDLWDEYRALGGNSFIAGVMEDYDDWLEALTKKGDTMGCGKGKKKK